MPGCVGKMTIEGGHHSIVFFQLDSRRVVPVCTWHSLFHSSTHKTTLLTSVLPVQDSIKAGKASDQIQPLEQGAKGIHTERAPWPSKRRARYVRGSMAITKETPGVLIDDLAATILTRAAAGEQLGTKDVAYLLNKRPKFNLPVSLEPPKQPSGEFFISGSLICLAVLKKMMNRLT